MNLGVKHVLFLLVFIVVLNGFIAAELEKDNSQTIRAAPLINTRDSVIDGSGTEGSFNTDGASNALDERKGGNSKVSVSTVGLFTMAMAAATGLGAIPFFFVELDAQWTGICNGMAAGVMLAASFDLIQEGRDHVSGNWAVIGILAGGIFIWLCKKVIDLWCPSSLLPATTL